MRKRAQEISRYNLCLHLYSFYGVGVFVVSAPQPSPDFARRGCLPGNPVMLDKHPVGANARTRVGIDQCR